MAESCGNGSQGHSGSGGYYRAGGGRDRECRKPLAGEWQRGLWGHLSGGGSEGAAGLL